MGLMKKKVRSGAEKANGISLSGALKYWFTSAPAWEMEILSNCQQRSRYRFCRFPFLLYYCLAQIFISNS